jgi:hypothetical protein
MKKFLPEKNLEPSRRKNSFLEKIWSPPDEKIPSGEKFGALPMKKFLPGKNLEPSRRKNSSGKNLWRISRRKTAT